MRRVLFGSRSLFTVRPVVVTPVVVAEGGRHFLTLSLDTIQRFNHWAGCVLDHTGTVRTLSAICCDEGAVGSGRGHRDHRWGVDGGGGHVVSVD